MKTKLMFAALAAAAVFTACNKENPVQEPVQPVNKSVVINLANVMPSTKAEGTTIANGTQITLNNYQVFFADAAGTLHTPKTETAVEGAETYFSFTDEGTPDVTKQFHFLPQSVKEVIVIGNYGEEIEVGDEEGQINTKTALMNLVKTLNIADQQDPTELMLYGIDQSLTAMPTNTNHTQVGEDVHPEPLFKAEINLHPAVARVEVTGFEYAQVPATGTQAAPARFFSEMTIENLSVINWYEAATVALVEDSVVDNQIVKGLSVVVDEDDQDAYFGGFYNDDTMFPDYLQPIKTAVEAMDEQPWYFDAIAETMPANYVLGANNVTAAGVDCYAYHVFPGATPRFIAELTGVNTVDGVDITTKLYLQTINDFTPACSSSSMTMISALLRSVSRLRSLLTSGMLRL